MKKLDFFCGFATIATTISTGEGDISMTYETLRQGARMALLLLEPDKAHSAEEVYNNVKKTYGSDDPRVSFHLEHLVFIGLAEKKRLGNDRVGYAITELGVRACNQLVSVQKKQLDIAL